MNYRILATDVDGTLLKDDGALSEDNILYINKAAEMGVKIVLASGRTESSLKKVVQKLGLSGKTNYAVSFNGGMLSELNSGDILYELRMPREYASYIVNVSTRRNILAVGYIGNQGFGNIDTALLRQYNTRTDKRIIVDADFADKSADDINKVVLLGDNKHLTEAKAYFEEWAAGKVEMYFTDKSILEFVGFEVSKGAALSRLADILGVKSGEVIAVGDSYNDISMLKYAGMPVAPANADFEIKRHCKYVTAATNNENALKEVVEKFIL